MSVRLDLLCLPSGLTSQRKPGCCVKTQGAHILGRGTNVEKGTDRENIPGVPYWDSSSWRHEWVVTGSITGKDAGCCRSSQKQEVPEKELTLLVIHLAPRVHCALASAFPTADRPPSLGRHPC